MGGPGSFRDTRWVLRGSLMTYALEYPCGPPSAGCEGPRPSQGSDEAVGKLQLVLFTPQLNMIALVKPFPSHFLFNFA